MVTGWSPFPPLFLTKVHFSGERTKCRLQYRSSLFSSLNTVGSQKLTGWLSPMLLFLGVWQQKHYCVVVGYLHRLMYATETHWMAFWSVIVKVAAAGWCRKPSWFICFDPAGICICSPHLICQKLKMGYVFTLMLVHQKTCFWLSFCGILQNDGRAQHLSLNFTHLHCIHIVFQKGKKDCL